MGNVVIKIDTGYVGATHECHTDLDREEWDDMTDQAKQEWINEEVWNHIQAYAIDEDTDEVVG